MIVQLDVHKTKNLLPEIESYMSFSTRCLSFLFDFIFLYLSKKINVKIYNLRAYPIDSLQVWHKLVSDNYINVANLIGAFLITALVYLLR